MFGIVAETFDCGSVICMFCEDFFGTESLISKFGLLNCDNTSNEVSAMVYENKPINGFIPPCIPDIGLKPIVDGNPLTIFDCNARASKGNLNRCCC